MTSGRAGLKNATGRPGGRIPPDLVWTRPSTKVRFYKDLSRDSGTGVKTRFLKKSLSREERRGSDNFHSIRIKNGGPESAVSFCESFVLLTERRRSLISLLLPFLVDISRVVNSW